MKIERLLIVGNPGEEHVGAHFLSAASELGLEADIFDVRKARAGLRVLDGLSHRLLEHRPFWLNRFSRRLVRFCEEFRPQLLLVTGISPPAAWALNQIGACGIRRVNFLTDDPWNPRNSAGFFWNSLREYDVVFTPRRSNIVDLQAHGCRRVEYLPFAYNPKYHFPESPVAAAELERFSCDVCIIGGADEDRVPLARALVNSGLKLRLYGGYWDKFEDLKKYHRGFVHGADLRKAVAGAAVNVCMVRKANRDGHAMRSFELPAMRACMIAEDTMEHREIYGEEGVGVCYFKTATQMVDKVKSLLMRPSDRERLRVLRAKKSSRAETHTLIACKKFSRLLKIMFRQSHRRTSQTFFFLTPAQWGQALFPSICLSLLTAWYTAWISPWIAISVGISALTVCHMAWSGRVVVSLPHIAVLIATLQYIFGAWINFYWPPTNPTYDLGASLPAYLSYAGPVIIAMTAGWMLGLTRLRPAAPIEESISQGLSFELDLLLVIGVGGLVLGRIVHIASLSFVFLLLSNLRYVSAYARMLLKGQGWKWRLGLVLAAEVFFAAGSTMFHDLLLWSLWTFALWVYRFKPRPLVVVACVIMAVILLPALQESKWQLRNAPLEDELRQDSPAGLDETPFVRAGAWFSYLGSSLRQTVTLNMDTDFIADIAVRYNQGWIINRVMAVVPEIEPYAAGSTLKEAAIAAVLPRFIVQEKVVAGGREKMLRYGGMDLGESTSMNLGVAGEMYANFGYAGGILACGAYALLFGLMFRAICNRAFQRPLWWSLVPFIFYGAVKAEDDVSFVLNWTVKATFLIGVVLILFPNYRRMLRQVRYHTAAPSVSALQTASNSPSVENVSAS